MSEDLLYTNTFIQPESKPNDENKINRENFRRFYEARYGLPAFRNAGKTANYNFAEAKGTQPKSSVSAQKETSPNNPQSSRDDNHNKQPNKGRAQALRTKIICLDSKDRDVSLYPSPAQFRIYLGEKFMNVHKISLVSTELPNTEQLVKSSPASKKNNKLYWQNGPNELDADEIYSITISDGNYTAATFAAELKAKTSVVQRILSSTSASDTYSDFNFVIDNITNTFTMRQNKTYTLDNPISTVGGSTTVTVSQDEHNLLPGQIINISGSSKVGGIPATSINASQVINVVSDKVDLIYRDPTDTSTYILYGTTMAPVQGCVKVDKNSYVVTGLGTKFLSSLSVGQVINIGYHNYVIQNIIDDSLLTVETPLLEAFNEYSQIINLTTGNSNGIEPVITDATKSTVHVIRTRLRNINYTSAQYADDQTYEATQNDLSIQNYKNMQDNITILDQTKTFKLTVPFYSRDPKYEVFNYFTVAADAQNFNLRSIPSNNNSFFIVDTNGNGHLITLPQGIISNIQIIATLISLLNGWEISFDKSAMILYFKPPFSNQQTRLTFRDINDYYYYSPSLKFDFSNGSSAASALGFPGSLVSGSVLIGSRSIDPNINLTFDNSLNSLYILNSNNVYQNEINLSRTNFANIVDLVNLLRSALISLGVPINISYNAGLQKVIFNPKIANYQFAIIFKISQTNALGLGDVLGFYSGNVHTNNCLCSSISLLNPLQTGFYTFPLAEYINCVPISPSLQVRGTAVVTNTLNVINGIYDIYRFPSAKAWSSLTNTSSGTASRNLVTGQLSGFQHNMITSTNAIETTLNAQDVYFSPNDISQYSPDAYLRQSNDVETFIVSLNVKGHFVYTRLSDGHMFDESSPLIVRATHTTVFDLRNLPSTSQWKISPTPNGLWAQGSELLSERRYMLGGKFLQLTPSLSSGLPERYLFAFDNFLETTCTTEIVKTRTLKFSIINGYIQISSPSSTSYSNPTTTPIIDLHVGNVYLLDYSQLATTSQASAPIDSLQLSTTVDGTHYFGQTFTAPYITASSNNILTLDLSRANAPFPDKLFYYSKLTKGAGGAGYFNIKFRYNSGCLKIVSPDINHYNVFASGEISCVLQNDTHFVENTSALIYSPFHNLTALSAVTNSSNISIINRNIMTAVSTNFTDDVYNVTIDNNRFVLADLTANLKFTIAIPVGILSGSDIASNLTNVINSSLGTSGTSLQWSVIFDATTSFFTFNILTSHKYRFIFTGIDTLSVDLFNSAAELLGFSVLDPSPDNTSFPTTIRSMYAANLQSNSQHIIKVPSNVTLASWQPSASLSWSESAIQDSNTSLQAIFPFPAQLQTGSRYKSDLTVGQTVLLGSDFDNIFTITSISNDYTFTVDSSVAFVSPTVAADGTIVAASATQFYVPVFKINSKNSTDFSNDDKLIFFRSSTNKSTPTDYVTSMTDIDLSINRISPIKLSIPESNVLLSNSLNDTADSVDFESISNHDLLYIKNDSKYTFNTANPATSSVSQRGGNPISIGTGVKFRLLFSNSDTPGALLGFPNVGDILQGDTGFKTVQSNTQQNKSSTFNIVKSEVGSGSMVGYLKILTETVHNFEYGDTVYIEGHSGSSNDLAVNNDEGQTITLVTSNLTETDITAGGTIIRGVFYIPLSLTTGGIGGVAYKRTLYRPFALAGDNYVYLTSPVLESLSTTSTKVSGVFAKLLLNAPPGAILFNSYVSTDKVYDEAPLPVLEHLDLSIVDMNGELFEFNNINWSASIAISYSSQSPSQTGMSSRTQELNDIQ